MSVPESPFERAKVGPPDAQAQELANLAEVGGVLALWDVVFLEVVVSAHRIAWIDRAVDAATPLPLSAADLSGPVFAFGDVDELLLDRLAVLSLGTVIRTQEELEATSSSHQVERPLNDRELTAWRAPYRSGGSLFCLLNAWNQLNLVELDLEARVVEVEPIGPGYRVGRIRPQAMCADGRPPDPFEAYDTFSEDTDFAPEALERLADMFPTIAAIANRAGVTQALQRRNFGRAIELMERAVALEPEHEHYRRNLAKIRAPLGNRDHAGGACNLIGIPAS